MFEIIWSYPLRSAIKEATPDNLAATSYQSPDVAVGREVGGLLVLHRVFPQKLELNVQLSLPLLLQLDVLHPQRAAAHGVRLVVVLLAPHAQRQNVNHPPGVHAG